MFDSKIRALIDPLLARPGQWLAANGVGADVITIGGCALEIAAALAVAFGQFAIALTLLIANRIADGLDGAVARTTQRTDLGVGTLTQESSRPINGGQCRGRMVMPRIFEGARGHCDDRGL
jgi:CDP-alcohol phosphatidyltransferase